jgi:hypothetical protein
MGRMGKIFVFLMIVSLLWLAGYAGYKSLPYLNSQLNNPNVFPQLRQLLKITPQPTATPAPVSPSPATPSATPSTISDSQVINRYLENTLGLRTHAGSVFCAYELLAIDTPNPHLWYLWALCQEYYRQQATVKTGAGISLPLSILTSKDGSLLKIISSRAPRAGADYQSDLQKIFPPGLITAKIQNPDPEMLTNLQHQVELARINSF